MFMPFRFVIVPYRDRLFHFAPFHVPAVQFCSISCLDSSILLCFMLPFRFTHFRVRAVSCLGRSVFLPFMFGPFHFALFHVPAVPLSEGGRLVTPAPW